MNTKQNSSQTPEGKTLKQFPSYIITADGNIWSMKTNKYLKPSLSCSNGYLQVTLTDINGKRSTIKVAQLVAKAFIGETPKGYTINHISSVKTQNNVSNLEIIPHSANMQHAVNTGLIKTLDDSPNSTKENDKVVSAIFEHLVCDTPKAVVAKKYNLSIQYLNQILWKKLRKDIWQNPFLSVLEPTI
jgi:hypothetical protein